MQHFLELFRLRNSLSTVPSFHVTFFLRRRSWRTRVSAGCCRCCEEEEEGGSSRVTIRDPVGGAAVWGVDLAIVLSRFGSEVSKGEVEQNRKANPITLRIKKRRLCLLAPLTYGQRLLSFFNKKIVSLDLVQTAINHIDYLFYKIIKFMSKFKLN